MVNTTFQICSTSARAWARSARRILLSRDADNGQGGGQDGLDMWGYEGGEALAPALASGFVALGTLRVWPHNS